MTEELTDSDREFLGLDAMPVSTPPQVEEAALQPFVELQVAIMDGWLILPVTNLWSGQESQIDEGYGRLKAGTSSKMAQMGLVYYVAMEWVDEGEPGPLPDNVISKEQYENIFKWLTEMHARMQVHYQDTLTSASAAALQAARENAGF